MTVTRASLKKTLKADLKRDGTVKVSDSYPREDLQGKTLTIRSKGTTICNGKGRCASEDHCVGLSLFVEDPEVPAPKKAGAKKIGWRHGTVKICLTYLQDKSGKPLVPLDQPLPARAKRSSRKDADTPREPENRVFSAPSNGHAEPLVGVTWKSLAYAHQDKDVDLLATYCRTLKSEHETMALRLVNAQAKLLERQEVSSELRGLSGVRGS